MKNTDKAHKQNSKHRVNDRWCLPILEALDGLDLSGPLIVCPLCKETGLAITKWVKGPTLKPIYILHLKRKKIEHVCGLNRAQADVIREKVRVPERDIKALLRAKKSFVLFSGGLDSLSTLIYLKRLNENVNGDLTALYVDTTAGIPENREYVEQVCEYLRVGLHIVRPKVDYFTLAGKWGIPSFRYRWCCRELKIKPIKEYLAAVGGPKVVFDGIRAAESNIRRKYIPIWYHPSFRCLSVSPIFCWTDEEVIRYASSNGIPRTFLHSLRTSTECWCGAYKTEKDFRKLYDLNRNIFYKLAKIENENGNRYTFIYKNGQQKTLRDLEREILKETNKYGRGE